MKNVLLLAFYFVPHNNIASYRSGCFAKYLPENGWQPTVICEEWPPDKPDYDPQFIGAFPESVRVVPVPNPKPKGLYQKVLIRKVFPYLWPHRVPGLFWRGARKAMRQVIRETRFDAVWATSDPMSPLAVAHEAASLARIPWVADIRDSFNAQQFGSWYKRPFFARQEGRLCARADAVVTVSRGLASVLERVTGRSVQVLRNGFDPALFVEEVPLDRNVFTIAYTGSLNWPKRNPAPVLDAVKLCLEQGRIPSGKIELSFYGVNPDLFRKFCPDASATVPVKILPRVSHKEIIRIQKSSAVLLLLTQPGEKGVLTGKIFDYLGAGRPILAVPEDKDEITELLRETGAGVSLTKVEDIASQLAEWYTAWSKGQPLQRVCDETAVARYSRREQTKALAAILNQVTGS